MTIYLDNAATTRVAPEVAAVVQACMRDDFGNPSSAHAAGIAAGKRIARARAALLAAVGDPDAEVGDVYWTSGGTEADAIGVIGAARARARRGKHMLCSAIEHPAVLESMALLERDGWTFDTIPVGPRGAVDVQRVVDMVTDETSVIALMLVNNEIGTINPVREAVRAAKSQRAGIHVHCDAVQALGKVPIDADALGVDSLAMSSHKLHGPKGVGALWLRKGARIDPLWAGGGQQRGVRSGTENVPGIAGFGEATRLAHAALGEHTARWTAMGETLLTMLRDAGAGAEQNCADSPRAPHIVSIGLRGAPGEPLLHALEGRGVLVSAGSACASKHRGPSHVLQAIHLPDDVGTLRISFGRDTTLDDVQRAAQTLIDVLAEL
jgi:cysteine desulfurase